jgi:hypothetical protein
MSVGGSGIAGINLVETKKVKGVWEGDEEM